jgi:decaprenylphospho-beta-D-ribofuranose 2-oxidase
MEQPTLIARGNGKSYGDASLADHVLCTLGLNKILSFDPENGVVHCQAGVLLSDLLPLIVPAGWFFQVTPGIKNITVGGAIASDVHGKNHPEKGCFSNWLLDFELLLSDGTVVSCSRTENTSLFWQTCGGMGWTGVILSARFQLMKLTGTTMQQTTVRCQDITAVFETFDQNKQVPYAAGWIDTTAHGRAFGRGAVHFAAHETGQQPLVWQGKKPVSVPFFAPSMLLNPLTIRAYNALYFSKNKSATRCVSLDTYFYPLDAIQHWNRLYGRRGFVQYQFCVPEMVAFEVIPALLQTIHNSQDTPFLSVLKRHGDRPVEAIHSFPEKGYSLALDFPRTGTILPLIARLDAQVYEAGGKIYLTKDACSQPNMGRVNPASFAAPKFRSRLRDRIEKQRM